MSGIKEMEETDKYKKFNHHHEIDREFQEIVDFGTGEFIADNHMIPLLESLNRNGLTTTKHNYDAKTGYSFVGISLNRIETIETRLYEGGNELLITWMQKPMQGKKEAKDV